jgi:hypothetical protein
VRRGFSRDLSIAAFPSARKKPGSPRSENDSCLALGRSSRGTKSEKLITCGSCLRKKLESLGPGPGGSALFRGPSSPPLRHGPTLQNDCLFSTTLSQALLVRPFRVSTLNLYSISTSIFILLYFIQLIFLSHSYLKYHPFLHKIVI